jgi:hypothetical protein
MNRDVIKQLAVASQVVAEDRTIKPFAKQAGWGSALKWGGRLLGAGGLGAFGLGHLNNAFRDDSSQEGFLKNYGGYKQLQHSGESALDNAYASNNIGQVNNLQKQLDSKTYSGGQSSLAPWNWRMGGLNPFAPASMGDYAKRLQANAPNESHINAMRQRMLSRGNQMSQSTRDNMRSQITEAEMRQRYLRGIGDTDAMKQNMENTNAQGYNPAAPGYSWQQFLQNPRVQGYALNPDDHQREVWSDVTARN